MTGQSGSDRPKRGREPDQPEAPAGAPGWSSGVDPISLLERALVDRRDRGDLAGQAQVLARLAAARYVAGDVDAAGETAAECEGVASLAGDASSLPWGALIQAMLAYDREDLDEALSRAQVALERFKATGDSTHVWRATMSCMLASISLGRLMEAREYCLDTIEIVERCGEEEKATALPELAALVLALGYPTEAIIVYSAGLTAAERLGVRYPPAAFDRYRARIAAARSHLLEAEFDAARGQGESLPLVDALEQVRQCVRTGRSRTSLPA